MSIHPLAGWRTAGRSARSDHPPTPPAPPASVITFGAAVRDLAAPFRGGMRRFVLGFAALDGYLDNRRYLGVTAGRHASRIGDGRLVLDGIVHQLSRNDGRHHLHGGATGFSRRIWDIVEVSESAVTLRLVSPDGEDGYPGRLDVRCTYRLEEPATLSVEMTATTDAPTIVSLAHHPYFTLAPGASIRGHRLQVPASRYRALRPGPGADGRPRAGRRHALRLPDAPPYRRPRSLGPVRLLPGARPGRGRAAAGRAPRAARWQPPARGRDDRAVPRAL